VATAVVSNFDTRLRPLLGLLGLEHLFDEIVVRCALASLFMQSTQVKALCISRVCVRERHFPKLHLEHIPWSPA